MKLSGTKEIKVFVDRLLVQRAADISGRIVVDIPAGSGHTSRTLKNLGAMVLPLDLFPAFFKVEGLTCERADLASSLPLADRSVDWIVFQEGIEHLADQLQPLREMNRALAPGGTLIVTTPNYSNMRARLSYFLNESEYYRYMPPNELESVWMAQEHSDEIYFGHIFNIGIQKLRLLGRLAGFTIVQVHPTRASSTAFLLFCLAYPAIAFMNFKAHRRALRKNQHSSPHQKQRVFDEQLRLGISPDILCSGHLIVEFRKIMEWKDVKRNLVSTMHSFDEAT
jgi:SAM-dependent methyltransferase